MKKLLASDLDGTLIFNGKISDDDIESIARLRKENNIFGVSTGRPYNGVSFLTRDYGIEIDFYVLLNGTLVLDKNLNVLKHEKIPFNIVENIFYEYKDCSLFGIDQGYETSILLGDSFYIWDNIHIRTIDDLRDKECSLISIDFSNKSPDVVEKICENINNKFSGSLVTYRNLSFIDIVPFGCSKGDGVNIISENLNIDKDNVYVIGDSFNDLSMFSITKNSFSFSNADEKIKNSVKYKVDSVSECINKYILGEVFWVLIIKYT